MISKGNVREIIGTTAYDRDGDRIGKVGQVYFDDDTDQPKWITVHTGFFGTHESFVPLQSADFAGDRVVIGYDKAKVTDAPRIGEDRHLSREEEQQLYRYYELDYGGWGGGGQYEGRHERGAGYQDRAEGRHEGAVGHDISGPTTDDAMTRSEERLNVGTETQERGRVRLRKHVVTEQQQMTVPVSREEVRLEREPITEANRAASYDGPAISEEEHEVTLREERPVVEKEAVPVERVRLGKETVSEQETVGGEVRKEEIDVDDATGDFGTRRR